MHGSQAHRIRRSPTSQQVAVVLGHRARRTGRSARPVAPAAAAARPGAGCPRAMRRSRATTSALSAPGGGSRHGASATFTFVPARPSSGTGSSWPSSAPSARPARGRSKPRPQRAQVRISPLSVASPRLGVAAGARAAIGQQRAVDVGHDELGAAQRHRAQLAGRDVAGARRAPSMSASASARAVAVGHLDLQQPGRRPGRLAGAATTPSTSRPARSGAASSIASLIASSSVAADAGQPLQWPYEAQPRHAVVDAEQLDVAAVGLHVGAHGGERLAHPRLEVDRVEVVDQQQAGDDAVLRRAARGSPGRPRRPRSSASTTRRRPSP